MDRYSKSSATGSGPSTGQDSTPDYIKEQSTPPYVGTSTPGPQARPFTAGDVDDGLDTSTAGLQAETSVARNVGNRLGLVTGIFSSSTTYIRDDASINSVSVHAGSYLSESEMEHVATEWEETSIQVLDHDGYTTAGRGYTFPILAQNTTSFMAYISEVGPNHTGTATNTASNSTLLVRRGPYSQFQLQRWVYEIDPGNQTLSERLEQRNWEVNCSANALGTPVIDYGSDVEEERGSFAELFL
ncbi:hypothetical protein VTL71DRAFT_7051 [Oculimacula yallundae]|uniref:Uncharacterized protein n=1 Tax=Oculimacula yallundae TaxID=86028 RepID=A0ABR4BVL6_9HELO